MAHQRRDVLAPIAQRRHVNRNDVEAVEQILAERALRDFFFEVLVGRGDHADVDLDDPVAAEPFELLLLKDAQHLGLRLQAHVADFVEEDRALVGLLELADLPIGGAGERALLVAEELRFDELVGNGGAVHLHERSVAAQALAMDGARHELLADAALAPDEHGRTGRRRLAQSRRARAPAAASRRRSGSASRRRAGTSGSRCAGARESSALRTVTSTRSLSSGFSMKSNAPSLVASTAVDTVPCPEMTTMGVTSTMCRSRCSTSRPSMPGILTSRKMQIGRFALGLRDAVFAGGRGQDFVTLVLEDHLQRVADRRLVVDDENPWLHRRSIRTVRMFFCSISGM